MELEFPAFARGRVEEVEFEVAEFGDSGFEADGNFLAGLMSCGRRDFNLQTGGLIQICGIGQHLACLITGADFGLEEAELRSFAGVKEEFLS